MRKSYDFSNAVQGVHHKDYNEGHSVRVLVGDDSPMSSDECQPLPPAASDSNLFHLTTQQIGRLGELLVQYELLRFGIDSAPMTTDAGVDLVAYSGEKGRSITLQVKTNLAPKRGGGKGSQAVDWWVSENCPAELYAFADLSTRRIWILTRQELESAAQQRSSGRLHLYMYTDPQSGSGSYSRHGDDRFSEFLFESRVVKLFD